MTLVNCTSSRWQKIRFDQMAECLTFRVNPSETTLERYVGLEHLDSETFKISRWGTPADIIGEKLHFWPGDIIFGKRRAYQRKLAVADFEGICSAHAMVLRARTEVVAPEFLPFFMQSDMFFERALSISVGSLSPTINWSTLARQDFPLPPLDDQHRIAEILWAAQSAIEKYQYVLSKLDIYSKAFWQSAVYEANNNSICLQEIAEVRNGATPKRNDDKYWNGNIPWLSSQKVNDQIITTADEYITEDGLVSSNLKIVPTNSTLIAMIGEGKTRGSVAFLTIDACINQNIACVIPKLSTDSWYVFFALSNMYHELRSLSQGGVGALNCSLIRNVKIPNLSNSRKQEYGIAYQGFLSKMKMLQMHLRSMSSMAKNLTNSII